MDITDKDKKALKILGAVALVGVLLFVFVLHKGGGGAGAAPTEASAGSSSTSSSDSGSGSGSQNDGKQGSTTGHTQTPTVFGGRDPFQPLVADTSSTSTSSSGTTPAVIPESPSPQPSPSPSPGTEKSTIQHGGHTVTLKDILTVSGQREAKVSVDATLYTAKVGQLIVDDFKLLGIHDTCADFVHVTHPFTLCLPSKTSK